MTSDRDVGCEFCERRTSCSNIYVALKVLESEMRYCGNPAITKRFSTLYHGIQVSGYGYPNSTGACTLAEDKGRTEGFLRQLKELLAEVRTCNKIS